MIQRPNVNGYPVLLHIEDRPCVVVGGGRVGTRKAAGLLSAGAQVTVISPELSSELAKLAADGEIQVVVKAYSPGLLDSLHPFLVFAATRSPDVNRQVAAEARAIGALFDAVDSTSRADFSSMAAIRRGLVIGAVSTGGASPALTVHLCNRLEAAIGPEYAQLASWLAEFRPQAQTQIPSEASRTALWEAMIDSPALALLRQGDFKAAHAVIQRLFDEAAAKDALT